MPIHFKVKPRTKPVDLYAAFKTDYEKKLLKLFKEGATLFVWRCSSPHNWYLETAQGEQFTISGDRETNRTRDIRDAGAVLRAFCQISKGAMKSAGRIAPARLGLHRDGGKAEKEGWNFDAELATRIEAEWAEVQTAYQARQENPSYAYLPNLSMLSSNALALLRTLRLQGRVEPFEELQPLLTELDQQGLLRMEKTGSYALTSDAANLKVPRGLYLRMQLA